MQIPSARCELRICTSRIRVLDAVVSHDLVRDEVQGFQCWFLKVGLPSQFEFGERKNTTSFSKSSCHLVSMLFGVSLRVAKHALSHGSRIAQLLIRFHALCLLRKRFCPQGMGLEQNRNSRKHARQNWRPEQKPYRHMSSPLFGKM